MMKNNQTAKPIKAPNVRKAKKTSDGNGVLVCPPDKAGKSPAIRITGIVCRALVTMFAVFGLALLFNDALRLSVGSGYLFLISLAATAFFTLAYIPKVGPFLCAGGAVAYVGIRFALDTDYFRMVAYSFAEVYNAFMQRLDDKNFLRVSGFTINVDSFEYDREALIKYGMVLFIIVIAAVFVPCVVKKTRLLLPSIISTLLLVAVFTFNMSNANWAFALIVASFGAVIVLSVYDRYYIKDPEKYKNNAETQLFGASDRPPMPDGVLSKQDAKAEKAKIKAERAELKRKRKEKTVTVDEEISDYFSVSKPKKAEKAEKTKKKSPETSKKKVKAQLGKVKKYDRITLTAKSAMGGFAGIGTFLLLMLILIFPALFTDSYFSPIPGLSDTMEFYRDYLTAFLQGDERVMDDLEYARDNSNFEPRSTDAEKIVYTGAQHFFIETSNPTDIYLRGWIATDYANGSWYTAEYRDDTFNLYRSLYSARYNYDSTPAENVYFDFLKTYLPYLARDVDFKDGRVIFSSAYGLLAEQVNIRRLAELGTNAYFPSKFNNGYKLRQYGEATESKLSYVNFFDGIYAGNSFGELPVDYAVVAYMFTQDAQDSNGNQRWVNFLTPYIAEFNVGYSQALNRVLGRIQDSNVLADESRRTRYIEQIASGLYSDVTKELSENGNVRVSLPDNYVSSGVYIIEPVNDDGEIIIRCGDVTYKINEDYEISRNPSTAVNLPFAVRYAGLYSAEEKLETAEMFYDYHIYRTFIYNTYTSTAESEVIKEFYTDMTKAFTIEEYAEFYRDDNGNWAMPEYINSRSAATYENRHQLVMKIINTLTDEANGYTYTLSPTAEPNPDLDGIENFLTVTKEGYCVQFASAAVLLLREAGIPARYVEGYIASDMQRYYNRDAEWSYYSIVKDENKHAWLEVWYDGLGWVPYEATPIYYDDAYGVEAEPGDDPDDPDEPIPPEDTDTPEEDTLPTEPDDTEPNDTEPADNTDTDNTMLTKTVLLLILALAVVGAIAATIIIVVRRGKRKIAEEYGLLDSAEKGEIPDGELHTAARRIIDITMTLLTVYGTPPGKSELRDDYAERISREYLDIFGKSVKIKMSKLTEEEIAALAGREYETVSDTDFTEIFGYIAAEEFSAEGMTADQLKSLAVFTKRLYNAMPSRLSGVKKIKYKYFRKK